VTTLGEVVALSVGWRAGQLTEEAVRELRDTDVLTGYGAFVPLVKHILPERAEVIADDSLDPASGTNRPTETAYRRAQTLVNRARDGRKAVLLSGGDTGLFGMAGVLHEVAAQAKATVKVRVVPGVSAVFSAAALLGAPLTDGFSVFSLAHAHTTPQRMNDRVRSALEADLVLVLLEPVHEATLVPENYPEDKYPEIYPLYKQNRRRLESLQALVAAHGGPHVPVGIVSSIGQDETAIVTTISKFADHIDNITYSSILVIGNSKTRTVNGRIVCLYW